MPPVLSIEEQVRDREDRRLSERERRAAMMYVAGASTEAISHCMEMTILAIRDILLRPHVAAFILKLQAQFVDDIRPAMTELSTRIEEHCERAFVVETTVMNRLFDVNEDHKEYVKAQLGAAATAQDILDRAGKRAATRTQNLNMHVVAPATIEALGRILKDDS